MNVFSSIVSSTSASTSKASGSDSDEESGISGISGVSNSGGGNSNAPNDVEILLDKLLNKLDNHAGLKALRATRSRQMFLQPKIKLLVTELILYTFMVFVQQTGHYHHSITN